LGVIHNGAAQLKNSIGTELSTSIGKNPRLGKVLLKNGSTYMLPFSLFRSIGLFRFRSGRSFLQIAFESIKKLSP
jgi:hypothetical protein